MRECHQILNDSLIWSICNCIYKDFAQNVANDGNFHTQNGSRAIEISRKAGLYKEWPDPGRRTFGLIRDRAHPRTHLH
jgi:hypothetical protein